MSEFGINSVNNVVKNVEDVHNNLGDWDNSWYTSLPITFVGSFIPKEVKKCFIWYIYPVD